MFGRRGSVSDWSNQAASTQEAFRSFFELIDPKHNKDSRKELKEIIDVLARDGKWVKDEEWRISTYMKASIEPDQKQTEQKWWRVTVECDGQILSCPCPSVERAFAFYKLYAHIIIYQYYSVGPPWAA